MTIDVRRAALDDVVSIHTLFADTIRFCCTGDYTNEQLRVWYSAMNDTRLIEKIVNQYFLVAMQSSTIVGFASLEKGTCVDLMYVHKDYQHKGIATRLYQHLELEARRVGAKVMQSDVSETARIFFERRGFLLLKKQTKTVDGVEIYNYAMEKRLHP